MPRAPGAAPPAWFPAAAAESGCARETVPEKLPQHRCARYRQSDAPARNIGKCAPRCLRAAAMTSCLVLPASVTTACGGSAGAMRANMPGICPTGAPTNTRSASATAAPRRSPPCRSRPGAARHSGSCGCGRRRPPASPCAPFQRQREGAADQADADDHKFIDTGFGRHGIPPGRWSGQATRACCNASRNRAFSVSSPIDTRRWSGMP